MPTNFSQLNLLFLARLSDEARELAVIQERFVENWNFFEAFSCRTSHDVEWREIDLVVIHDILETWSVISHYVNHIIEQLP